ncbi:MAG TPA: SpoIVB peptidase S55 domain-containing protein [Verrucomicrobiae bacterium]|nr:SpoIVB peptidase S55 domain-containing protein [Verrucomicrobiae bacterium]
MLRASWAGILAWLGAAMIVAGPGRAATVTIPVDEIRPGMRGVVMTVLRGTNAEPVETEILGVLRNGIGPGKHMIIGRLVDEKTRVTGAVHGMSGSPLYIDGRLAGALSRRVAIFEKDGHCGFTPIEDMLETGAYLDGGARRPARFSMRRLVREGLLGGGITSDWLALPLEVSGATGRALRALEKLWAGAGVILASGGGGRGDADAPGGELTPGAAVSAAFLTGDITMGGTGTLTWRDGDRVLAFGHPMMGLGEVEMPMCEAEIITTVPSYQRPFKMANIRRVAGTVLEDRFSAIAGRVGPKPVLPAYRVRVDFEGRGPVEYRGNFLAQREMAPSVVASLLIDSVLGSEHVGEEMTICVTGAMRLRNGQALRLDGFSSGDAEVVVDAAMDMRGRLKRVFEQPFEEIHPEGLDLDVRVAQRREEARIESVTLWPRQARPGEVVRVEVRLERRWGGEEHREFEFTVPEEARAGEVLRVEANDERTFLAKDSGTGGGGTGLLALFGSRREEGPGPRSLGELIEGMNRLGRANVLMVRVSRQQDGVRDGWGRHEDVPGSVAAVLRNGPSEVEAISDSVVAEMRQATEGAVEGSSVARLTVR